MTGDADRIEELRSRVRELEATVQGLTEELVEANERIRALEEADGPDQETLAGYDADPVADGQADTSKGAERQGDEKEDDEESDLDDDIIIA